MEKKRSIFAAAILVAVFGTAAVYIGFYRLPAVRFAHRIFPLIYRSETVSEYRKDGYAIRVEDGLPQSTVQFLSPDGARQTFFVSQEGYEVTAAQSEPLLSGIWQDGQLRGSDGKNCRNIRKWSCTPRRTPLYPALRRRSIFTRPMPPVCAAANARR